MGFGGGVVNEPTHLPSLFQKPFEIQPTPLLLPMALLVTLHELINCGLRIKNVFSIFKGL